MEIKLFDNSRLYFERLKSGAVNISLFQPGDLPDGHGMLLKGSVVLSKQETAAFIAALQSPKAEQQQEVA